MLVCTAWPWTLAPSSGQYAHLARSNNDREGGELIYCMSKKCCPARSRIIRSTNIRFNPIASSPRRILTNRRFSANCSRSLVHFYVVRKNWTRLLGHRVTTISWFPPAPLQQNIKPGLKTRENWTKWRVGGTWLARLACDVMAEWKMTYRTL